MRGRPEGTTEVRQDVLPVARPLLPVLAPDHDDPSGDPEQSPVPRSAKFLPVRPEDLPRVLLLPAHGAIPAATKAAYWTT
jgi:hypothetical protein